MLYTFRIKPAKTHIVTLTGKCPERDRKCQTGSSAFLPDFFAAFPVLHDLCHKISHRLCRPILLLPGGVGVGAEGEARIVVAQHSGYRFHIHTVLQCHGREGMPLWHNKDKSENPCGATGLRFVLILFPLKSGPKMGSTGGGDKQGLHLKDKFSHANSSAIILCNSSHKLLICFGIVVHICLIPAIILPAYLRIENARTCTTSSLGIFFKVSR